jgi:putative spermidine/putrescine transport system ATP-binding protein
MGEGRRIRLEGVTVRYGSTTAVESVSLEVRPGEFLSLLGPSGCGKTTTLRAIAGFVSCAAGRIEIDGTEVTATPAHRRGVGLVFQNYALWPHMTVFENVAFGLKLRHVEGPRLRAKVDEVIALTNLTGFERRYPRELSGGQQQRVAMARALALDPPVLLMDEPLSNLDRKLRIEMRRELKQLQYRLGTTTLYVTHDQEEALSMSDRVGVMDKGRILRIGKPDEIYDNPGNEFIAGFVGNINLLEGTVDSSAKDVCTVRTDDGLSLTIAHSAQLATGLRVRLMVRPERIRLAAGRPAELNALSGRVAFVEYFGTTIRYYVELGGGRQLSVQCQNTGVGRFAVGDHVFAVIDAHNLIVVQ